MTVPYGFSWRGDQSEAQRSLGKARRELFRLQTRMTALGVDQGQFFHRLSDTAYCYGFILPGGLARIHIVAEPREGGAEQKEMFYFEFLTTGRPVEIQTAVSSVASFKQYKAAVVMVDVTREGSNLSARATIGNGEKAYHIEPNTPLRRPAQLTLTDEPAGNPNDAEIASAQTTLYESYAPNHPYTGVMLRAYYRRAMYESSFDNVTGGFRTYRGAANAYLIRDVDFDIPFQKGAGYAPVKRAYIRDDADWPRVSAIQTVTDSIHGRRTFGIYGDAFGQFFVFPIDAIEAEITSPPYSQNVDSIYVKMVTPTLPSWAFAPPRKFTEEWAAKEFMSLLTFPDIDWKFNHSGTKACAVVFERRAANFDSAYFAVDQSVDPATQARFNFYRDYRTGCLSAHNITFKKNSLPQRYSVAPGLIEAAFTITLTGSGLADFEVVAPVVELRRPTTSDRCTFLAGYCWHDIKADDWTKDNQHYDARAGDLCALDIEKWYTGGIVSGFVTGATLSFMSLQNLTSTQEVRAFPSDNGGFGAYVEGRFPGSCLYSTLIDYDFTTLSFALRMDHLTRDLRDMPVLPNGPTGPTQSTLYDTFHFGVNIYTMNRQREMLFPENISVATKEALLALKDVSGRDAVPDNAYYGTLSYMPLNALDDWSNSGYAQMRDWFMSAMPDQSTKTFSPPAVQPSDSIVATLMFGGHGSVDDHNVFLLTDPCFGWHGYAYELSKRIDGLTPHSTFFVNKNGTWAFYDQQFIYDRNGTPEEFLDVDTLTSFDPELIEHVILDRVHLQWGEASKDTSFRELYNSAVDAGNLNADLQKIEIPQLRATFDMVPTTDTEPLGLWSTWANLEITWHGVTGYLPMGEYRNAAISYYYYLGLGDKGALGGLTLGAILWKAPAYGGGGLMLHDAADPIKFSSCVLIGG